MAMFVAKTCGPLHEVEEFTRMLAGAEVNVAIGLKRLGHSVAYVTKLGTDPFGTYIENKLKSEGLDVQISKDEDHFTGYQLKGKVMEGDPEVFYYRRNSAASCLSTEDIEKVNLEGARVLHITGIPPALSKSCCKATYRLIERAREKNMLVSFDPNLRPTLWESQEVMIETINDIASRADIVLPGTAEGKILMGSDKPEGHVCGLKKTTMLVLAVTLHNIPEGMAVGVVFAGFLAEKSGITLAAALALSFGIAIQNFPEGAIISLPLRSESGMSRKKAFAMGTLSGIVEPIGALATIAAYRYLEPVLPVLLALAAGAMIYVVVEELIPESAQGSHSDMGTIGFAVGFVLMMILDVALG